MKTKKSMAIDESLKVQSKTASFPWRTSREGNALYLLMGVMLALTLVGMPRAGAQVILQGYMGGPQWLGRDGNGNSVWDTNHSWGVPCPLDANSVGGVPTQWWYDKVAQNANYWASKGFTAIWLPPPSKGSGGIYDGGYGVFDDYDLGDKNQEGNYQTRYGSREQLNRSIAMLRANGISVYTDFVTNQRLGANIQNPVGPDYQWFQYLDAYGNANGGRFPKYYQDFHVNSIPSGFGVQQDPFVPATTYPDGSSTGKSEGFFGPDFAPINGEVKNYPDVYCALGLKQWGDWVMKATGIQGYRLDDCAGISWWWLPSFVNYGAMSNRFVVAELVGPPYSTYQVRDWMHNCMGKSGANFTTFDQSLEATLQTMCNTANWWAGALQSKYLCWSSGGGTNAMDPSAGSVDPGPWDIFRSVMSVDPLQVVSVVNEIDSDSGPSSVGPDRSLLGYAYIMTIGFGTPCVDVKDWSTAAGCYGGYAIDGQNLQTWLANLIWCHKFVTTGGFGREQINGSGHVYGFERTGGNKALVFLNSDWTSSETITFNTDIPNGTVLQDYSYHSGFANVTVSGGAVTVTVPANVNGRGYLVLAPAGISGSFSLTRKSVTQQWEANSDLSIPPAGSTKAEVCRVWVDKGRTLTARLADYNTANWTGNTQLTLEIDQSSLDNLSNTYVSSKSFTSSMKGQTLVITNSSGAPSFYSLYVTGRNLPGSGGPWWFKLENTYTASQTAPSNFNDSGNIYH